jgi:hypothetical protein
MHLWPLAVAVLAACGGATDTTGTAGNNTTHLVSGLVPNTRFFAVTSVDDSGNESAFSTEAPTVVR